MRLRNYHDATQLTYQNPCQQSPNIVLWLVLEPRQVDRVCVDVHALKSSNCCAISHTCCWTLSVVLWKLVKSYFLGCSSWTLLSTIFRCSCTSYSVVTTLTSNCPPISWNSWSWAEHFCCCSCAQVDCCCKSFNYSSHVIWTISGIALSDVFNVVSWPSAS